MLLKIYTYAVNLDHQDIYWNNHLHHSQCPRYSFQSLQVVPRTFLQALQLYEIIMMNMKLLSAPFFFFFKSPFGTIKQDM